MKYGMAHAARTIPLKQKTNNILKVEQRYCYLIKSYFDKHYNLDMYYCM